MFKKYKISAPGKIILSGEHAVVYGSPAILAAVNRRLYIGKKGNRILIDSNIPIGCGMGSSAAYAVALSALKSKSWNLEKINKEAYKMERKQHGNPSGGDNTISTYGGFLWYRKETEGLKTFSPIKIKINLPKLFLINTGKPAESTKEMILLVAKFWKKHPARFSKIFSDIETVTKKFLQYLLKENNYRFSNLIKENERLLEELGVVSESTQEIVWEIEKSGGVAKISGAGGRKDKSGILIVYHKDAKKLQDFAKKKNLDLFKVKLGEEGVRIEK
jgi:mevalonate kinase